MRTSASQPSRGKSVLKPVRAKNPALEDRVRSLEREVAELRKLLSQQAKPDEIASDGPAGGGLLGREIAFYQSKLKTWLRKHSGKFVVVHGEELIGVFDDRQEALSAGWKRLGREPFLVRQVARGEDVIRLSL